MSRETSTDDLGTCLYLDLVERELADRRRIISAGEQLVSFPPYAAAAAYETWIVPRFHRSFFGSIDDATLDELARHCDACYWRCAITSTIRPITS